MEGIHKVHEGQVLKSLHSEHVDDFAQVNDARWLLRNYFQLEYREHGEKNRVVYRVLEGLSCDAAGGLVWGVCQWYKLTWENKRESICVCDECRKSEARDREFDVVFLPQTCLIFFRADNLLKTHGENDEFLAVL